jgi:hypothetical protein
VTAFERGAIHAGRGGLAMEGIPDRRSARIFTDRTQSTVSAVPAGLITRKRGGSPRGGDRGVRGTASPGSVRNNERRTPTRDCPPKRIRRLEPPGPPASIIQGASPGRRGEAQASKRCRERDVARVLVVESSGKQKSVERIRLVLRVLSQGGPQEDESARRKPLDPLTRRVAVHLEKR